MKIKKQGITSSHCCRKMSEIVTYKNSIVDYLKAEKAAYENDIENHKSLNDEEKEEIGLLIRNAKVVSRKDNEIKFSVEVNNTKLRPGDNVVLMDEESLVHYNATVIENAFEEIELSCDYLLNEESSFSIKIFERVFLDTIIKLTESIEDGAPGSAFFELLSGSESPSLSGLGGFSVSKPEFGKLNSVQVAICEAVLKRPSLYCIQGPPGTGKTDVLATIAVLFSKKGKDVLIISNTHQAVNNALNKITTKTVTLPLVKIGEELKAQELDGHIMVAKSYHKYLEYRKTLKKRPREGSVVGMTLHAAVINLGLRQSGFKPSVVLVDEAGQMPFAEAACIGSFGCGSVVLIGDDKQMPPIFHETLKDHEFSKSIFSYVCDKYPHLKAKLSVTYRMNEEITDYVSKRFYEPFGEKLIASDYSKDRKLVMNSSCSDTRIKEVLSSEKSIHLFNVSVQNDWEDYNAEEAQFIATLIKEAIACGLEPEEVAVITPYRKQVRTIREYVKADLDGRDLPLIDTVERLQGQDVAMIIVSFCVTSPSYYKSNAEFLLSPNRLNVMVSRAKQKVVLLGANMILDLLSE